ncbi:MAG TPA: sensor histidine kinase [Dehalococcoidia bacterium]|nr:sensor histidine kinase [Dehalococcoidia bacterium]
MSLRRLKWLAIALPVAFVLCLQLATETVLAPKLGYWPGHVAAAAFFTAGVVLFASVIFGWLERSQNAIIDRTRELAVLNELGRRLTESVDREESASLALDAAVRLLRPSAVGFSEQAHDGTRRVWRAAGAGSDELSCALSEAGAGPPDPVRQVVSTQGEPGVLLSAPVAGEPSLYLHALLDARAEAALAHPQRLLQGVANHAAAAFERCRLFEDIRARASRSRALYEIGLEVATSQELGRVLKRVTANARDLLGASGAALCLVEEKTGRLRLAEVAGEDVLAGDAVHSNGHTRMNGTAPLLTSDLRSCPLIAEPLRRGLLRSRLIAGSQVVGELCVALPPGRVASEEEQALLAALADMAAIAINNARLLERERQLAVLEERDHLAREMHDTLAQVLGYLHLKAATTRRRLASGDLSDAENELQEMEDLAHEAYVDVREAILGLRETVAPAEGLVGSIRQYLQKFSRQFGIKTRLVPVGDVNTTLRPEAEVQLVRVIQEALTNVRKHSGAATATVRLENRDGELEITIEDDGCGFDASRIERQEGRSFGMQSMRERVERAGGALAIDSAPGRGTRVIVRLPVEEGGWYVRRQSVVG